MNCSTVEDNSSNSEDIYIDMRLILQIISKIDTNNLIFKKFPPRIEGNK